MTVQGIYASTSGNVEIVMEKVAQLLTADGIPLELHRSEQIDVSLIEQNQVFIFACSTWLHGELNPFFNQLYKGMKGLDFTGKKATFVGLGDMRYEPVLFNQAIKIIRDRWLAQNGEEFHRQLLINGEPYGVLDTTVLTWTQQLSGLLRTESPA